MAPFLTVVEYLYDGMDRRVKKDLSGEGIDVIFLYEAWRCIDQREIDGESAQAADPTRGAEKLNMVSPELAGAGGGICGVPGT